MPEPLYPPPVKRACVWQQQAGETAVAGRNLERIRAPQGPKSLERIQVPAEALLKV